MWRGEGGMEGGRQYNELKLMFEHAPAFVAIYIDATALFLLEI